MDVKIKGVQLVAQWRWDVRDDTCGICRAPFEGCCPQCRVPGDDCPIITGACTHTFHIHCIEKVRSQDENMLCPMCRKPWDT